MEYLLLSLILPVIILTSWFYTASIARSRFPILREKAIILLIAHPDDEAMFFSPTVLSLTRPELGNHLKILCLSSGNAENLGPIRKKEIVASARILGLRDDADVHVIDDPAFPDSMREHWDETKISQLLDAFFTKGSGRKRTTTIDVLITFDSTGISSHPNHISLQAGARRWIQDLTSGRSTRDAPVTLYTLSSTNVFRKYASFLDAPFTLVACVLDGMMHTSARGKREFPSRLMFLSDFAAYRRAQRAMTEAHRSQMVWFRWGWIALSRFMVVNDLRKVRVPVK